MAVAAFAPIPGYFDGHCGDVGIKCDDPDTDGECLCIVGERQTWTQSGGGAFPETNSAEGIIEERTAGSLWMLPRRKAGFTECFPTDNGARWSGHCDIRLAPDDRYFGCAENNHAEVSGGCIAMIFRAGGPGGMLYRSESQDGGKFCADAGAAK